MKVLFCSTARPHGHDYAAGFLFDGFATVCDTVLWPRTPYLVLPEDPKRSGSRYPDPSTRDACHLDCDQAWPESIVGSDDAVFGDLAAGNFDLIVGTTSAIESYRAARNRNAHDAPCALIDGSDSGQRRDDGAGGVLFKRELPIGATWAHPCPLTYPLRRVVLTDSQPRSGVVYCTSVHGGQAGARCTIAEGLESTEDAFVATDDDRARRPSLEALHERLGRGLVGIHWNPLVPVSSLRQETDSGWDGNRLHENLAFGVAVVSLRPFIQIPEPAFVHGEHLIYVDSPEEAIAEAKWLLSDPWTALDIARKGQLHFMQHHSSVARARYVAKTCGVTL